MRLRKELAEVEEKRKCLYKEVARETRGKPSHIPEPSGMRAIASSRNISRLIASLSPTSISGKVLITLTKSLIVFSHFSEGRVFSHNNAFHFLA